MPDYQHLATIRQNMSALMQYAGLTATWRQYISASAGQAEFGNATSLYYVQRPITALFDPVRPQEVWQAGGYFQVGDVRVTTIEPLSTRDEMQWEGNRYKAIGEPVLMPLFGSAYYQSVMRRG